MILKTLTLTALAIALCSCGPSTPKVTEEIKKEITNAVSSTLAENFSAPIPVGKFSIILGHGTYPEGFEELSETSEEVLISTDRAKALFALGKEIQLYKVDEIADSELGQVEKIKKAQNQMMYFRLNVADQAKKDGLIVAIPNNRSVARLAFYKAENVAVTSIKEFKSAGQSSADESYLASGTFVLSATKAGKICENKDKPDGMFRALLKKNPVTKMFSAEVADFGYVSDNKWLTSKIP